MGASSSGKNEQPRSRKRRNDDKDEHQDVNETDEHDNKRRKFEMPFSTSAWAKAPGYIVASRSLPESQRKQISDFLQDPEIQTIVEKTIIAVMVSSRTESYSLHALVYHTMNSLTALPRFWVPVDWEVDSKEMRKFVEWQVFRTRARFEREIKSSVDLPDPRHHVDIKQLTRDLLAPSDMQLTVEACARVAVMRSVLLDVTVDFWAALDKMLLCLCCGSTAMSSVREFNKILAIDEVAHGAEPGFSEELDRNRVDEWQQHVDSKICGFIFPLAAAQVY
ncbi:hypothetical protein Hypma_005825 [Hypsizygus marmoreus]|uniref:Uncharacterized protein n=1 Tax=Hypsizygus marmoreus TaxID=39966 RepID=A0A369KIP5_HYPMA|nr:hypothetical protein Hypma_005825 [Hypsizygus marmoreus]